MELQKVFKHSYMDELRKRRQPNITFTQQPSQQVALKD